MSISLASLDTCQDRNYLDNIEQDCCANNIYLIDICSSPVATPELSRLDRFSRDWTSLMVTEDASRLD